jgi:acyl carrier protein
LECFGRLDDQVKIRGFRVELGEIESILSKNSLVKQAVVLPKFIEGEKSLVAFLVLISNVKKDDQGEVLKAIRIAIAKELPDYMIPSSWSILNEFPLNSSQKIDRAKLERLKIQKIQSNILNLPESSLELQIANVWKKFLKVREIGLDDDFFELGGHSLLAVEIISEIEKTINDSVSLNDIFKYKTIRKLTENISKQEMEKEEEKSLVAIKSSGSKRPLYILHGIGCSVTSYYKLGELFEEDQPLYGFQVKGISGKSDPHSSIEEMASYYIMEMQNHQKEGPYSLAGYSFGGYVAYEMARQLIAKGVTVAHLIIFDTTILDNRPTTIIEKLIIELRKRRTEAVFIFKLPKRVFGK